MSLTELRGQINRMKLQVADIQRDIVTHVDSESGKKVYGRYMVNIAASVSGFVQGIFLTLLRAGNLLNPFGKEGEWTTKEDWKKRTALLGHSLKQLPRNLWLSIESLGLWIADKVTWGSWHEKVETRLVTIAENELFHAVFDVEHDIHIEQEERDAYRKWYTTTYEAFDATQRPAVQA